MRTRFSSGCRHDVTLPRFRHPQLLGNWISLRDLAAMACWGDTDLTVIDGLEDRMEFLMYYDALSSHSNKTWGGATQTALSLSNR